MKRIGTGESVPSVTLQTLSAAAEAFEPLAGFVQSDERGAFALFIGNALALSHQSNERATRKPMPCVREFASVERRAAARRTGAWSL